MKLTVKYFKFYQNKCKITRLIINLVLIVCSTGSVYAKNNTYYEDYKYTYDSIMSILNNKNVSFNEKYELTYHTNNLSYAQTLDIFLNAAEQGKANPDNNKLSRLYSYAALFNIMLFDNDGTEPLLLKASAYAEKANDPESLGIYHYAYGTYYAINDNDTEAYKHYYKAISYYETSDKLSDKVIPVYYSTAYIYSELRDCSSLKTIIDKMLPIALKQKRPDNLINTYTLMAHYYSYLFEKDESQKKYLDSAIIYDSKAIDIFKGIKDPPTPFTEHIGRNYTNLAENVMKLQEWKPDSAAHYLSKAEQYINSSDTISLINYHWVKSIFLYKSGNIDGAKAECDMQLSMLRNTGISYSARINLYGMLVTIYAAEGDYKTALKYEQLKSEYKDKLHDKNRYTTIQNMNIKYDIEKKEQEIQQLKNQKKINFLLIGFCISALIGSFFIIHWQRLRKRSIFDQLQIANMKKEEAELKDELKEEQLARMELERYEFLLEVQYKDEAIEGKEDELNALKKEKELLDEQLLKYSEKLKLYETSYNKVQVQKASEDKLIDNIINPLISQIQKRLSLDPKQNDYIERIENINEKFLLFLTSECINGNFTVSYSIYCTCFVIGMDRKAISECLSVEMKTIRQTRTRIKSKLGLDKDKDLDEFLYKKLYGND